MLDETCRNQSAAFLRVATLAPRVSVQVVQQERVEGHVRTHLRIANHGYLGTVGVPAATRTEDGKQAHNTKP